MLFFYLLLFLAALYKCRARSSSFWIPECVSRPVTDSIKGVFIWLVFLSHFSSYVTYVDPIDIWGGKISALLGQLVVACFLFYSGFGVCEAIKHRGNKYIRSFPKNRILKTLIHFSAAVALFGVVGFFIGSRFSLKRILLSLIGWDSLGNSNWYIFVILALYLITWMSFLLAKQRIMGMLYYVFFLSCCLVVFLRHTRPAYWYDTCFCYILGMWVSANKEALWKKLATSNKSYLTYSSILLMLFCIAYLTAAETGPGLIGLLLRPVLFCSLIFVFSLKFRISNRWLIWSGQYTFELYILQRLPMIVFREMGIAACNMYIYFLLCVVATIGLSVIFRRFISKADERLFAARSGTA